MNKQTRHRIITEIVKTIKIDCQDTLLNSLINRGVNITQATLSRDIKELKIVKVPTATGGYAYQLPNQLINDVSEKPYHLSSFGFVNIEFSGQLAVMKTRPGYAMAIAGEIDQKANKTILGTVAGDDTILIIPKEGISKDDVIKSLALFISGI